MSPKKKQDAGKEIHPVSSWWQQPAACAWAQKSQSCAKSRANNARHVPLRLGLFVIRIPLQQCLQVLKWCKQHEQSASMSVNTSVRILTLQSHFTNQPCVTNNKRKIKWQLSFITVQVLQIAHSLCLEDKPRKNQARSGKLTEGMTGKHVVNLGAGACAPSLSLSLSLCLSLSLSVCFGPYYVSMAGLDGHRLSGREP